MAESVLLYVALLFALQKAGALLSHQAFKRDEGNQARRCQRMSLVRESGSRSKYQSISRTGPGGVSRVSSVDETVSGKKKTTECCGSNKSEASETTDARRPKRVGTSREACHARLRRKMQRPSNDNEATWAAKLDYQHAATLIPRCIACLDDGHAQPACARLAI